MHSRIGLTISLAYLFLSGYNGDFKTVEDTIYEYYELLYSGKLEKSQELLEWDHNEASIIDYFASMNKLQKQHEIKRIKDLILTSINESDSRGEATVKIIYEDVNHKEILEFNKIRLSQNRRGYWKITSIIRE